MARLAEGTSAGGGRRLLRRAAARRHGAAAAEDGARGMTTHFAGSGREVLAFEQALGSHVSQSEGPEIT